MLLVFSSSNQNSNLTDVVRYLCDWRELNQPAWSRSTSSPGVQALVCVTGRIHHTLQNLDWVHFSEGYLFACTITRRYTSGYCLQAVPRYNIKTSTSPLDNIPNPPQIQPLPPPHPQHCQLETFPLLSGFSDSLLLMLYFSLRTVPMWAGLPTFQRYKPPLHIACSFWPLKLKAYIKETSQTAPKSRLAWRYSGSAGFQSRPTLSWFRSYKTNASFRILSNSTFIFCPKIRGWAVPSSGD